jgi:hypothetical protein
MESANQAIALGTNHCTNIQMENDIVHPVTGKKWNTRYSRKSQPLSPFGKEVLETSWDAFSKASATYKEHTLVSLLSSQTSPKTDKSHMKKLSVTIYINIILFILIALAHV